MVEQHSPAGLAMFVNSAGYGQSQDYRWRRVESPSPGTVRLDAVAGDVLGRLEPLLREADSSTIVSLAWQRVSGIDWLLICNLPTGRRDFNGRPIGNTVAWSAGPDAARILRGIVVLCLSGAEAFEALLSGLTPDVRGDDALGWTVDGAVVESLHAAAKAVALADGDASGDRLYAAYSAGTLAQLAAELAASAPPDGDGMRMLVSPHHTPDALAKLRPWRSVSGGPGVPSDWQPLPAPPTLVAAKSVRKGCSAVAALVLVGIAVVIAASRLLIGIPGHGM